MLRIKGNTVLVQEMPDFVEKLFIQWSRTSNGKGKPVAHERIALGEIAQIAPCRAAEIDPVFGSDLKEIDSVGNAVFQGGDQLTPQAQPGSGHSGKIQGWNYFFIAPWGAALAPLDLVPPYASASG